MLYSDRVFQGDRIVLDGNAYKRCKFLECQLVFSGEAGVDFDDCLFRKCNWVFKGAATTLSFLGALDRGTRAGSDYDLFGALINAIRQGVVSNVSNAPEPALATR